MSNYNNTGGQYYTSSQTNLVDLSSVQSVSNKRFKGCSTVDVADATKIIIINPSNQSTGITGTLRSLATSNHTWYLPDADGTLAVIPVVGSYVDTNSDQTIVGLKTFSGIPVIQQIRDGFGDAHPFVHSVDGDEIVTGLATQTIQNKDLLNDTFSEGQLRWHAALGTLGTAAAPAIGFVNSTPTVSGIYSLNGRDIEFTIEGVQALKLNSTVLQIIGTQTLKALINADNSPMVDNSDNTKRILFSASGNTTGKTLTLASACTLDRTLTYPNATDTLVGKATTDTMTNKTLTSAVLNTPSITTPSFTAGHYSTYYSYKLSGTVSDKTGDGTIYTLLADNASADVSVSNSGTTFSAGTFTIGATGTYWIFANVVLSGLLSSHTDGRLAVNKNSGTKATLATGDPGVYAAVGSGQITWSGMTMLSLAATDTIKIEVQVNNGTKVVDIHQGDTLGGTRVILVQIA